MAYAVPKQWSHGDQPAATDMQKYSDGLNYLDGMFGATRYNRAYPDSLYDDTQDFWLVHQACYLVFTSTGRIVDPAGVEDDVSISPGDKTYGSYDLATIQWLVYGKLYRVIGCSVCFEDGTGA